MRLLRAIQPLGGLFAAISFAASAHAADYDQTYRRPVGPPPPANVYAGVDPRCRVVPQPEANLFGSTARFRPTLICTSRGMYADSFGPYPFYYPYQGGYGYER